MNEKLINAMLDKVSSTAWKALWDELNTDENADYRRGFRAGILCSTLQVKSDIGNLKDASTERPEGTEF
jgi:hypothetical protein